MTESINNSPKTAVTTFGSCKSLCVRANVAGLLPGRFRIEESCCLMSSIMEYRRGR